MCKIITILFCLLEKLENVAHIALSIRERIRSFAVITLTDSKNILTRKTRKHNLLPIQLRLKLSCLDVQLKMPKDNLIKFAYYTLLVNQNEI